MKKNVFVLLVALFATLTVNAADIKIETLNYGKKISIAFDPVIKEADIILKDLQGVILWDGKLDRKTAPTKVLNLEKLPDGKYEVIVNTPTRELIQPVTIAKAGIEVIQHERMEYFKPAVVAKRDFVDLTFLNSKPGDVTVKIIDFDGNVVHEENHEAALKVGRRYKVEDLLEGFYTLVLKTGTKSYYNRFYLAN